MAADTVNTALQNLDKAVAAVHDAVATQPSIADAAHALSGGVIDPFVFRLAIFVLSIFVGYYVVWSVTPALHTPLMAVTNAISSVIIVGALVAGAAKGAAASSWLGLAAVVMASINIFGGFAVTARMLAMYKKKQKG